MRLLASFLRILTLLLAAACAADHSAREGWLLDDGTSLLSRAVADRPTVVLVLDPAEVFTCASTLSRWLEWRAGNPGRFLLVFTRPPSRSEKKRLLTVRLPLSGTLAEPPGGKTPVELVIARGRMVYADSAIAETGRSVLLTALRRQSLDTFAAAPLAAIKSARTQPTHPRRAP